MKIRITVQSLDTNQEITRDYDLENTEMPWNYEIEEMLDVLRNEDIEF